MSYTTKDKIIALFNMDEVEEITDERFTLLISQTDELIHSYLAPTGLYILPLEPVPSLIESIAVDIARWEMMADDRIYIGEKLEGLETRYNNALKLLQNLRDGLLFLSADVLLPRGVIEIKAPVRCFTTETLSSF